MEIHESFDEMQASLNRLLQPFYSTNALDRDLELLEDAVSTI